MSRKEYAVKAETFDGRIVILKRGFRSRVSAEDTQIRHAQWKRVWIGEVSGRYTSYDCRAKLPWHIEWGREKDPSYLIDADGKQLAVLTGSMDAQESLANTLVELMALFGEMKAPESSAA